MYEGLDKSKMWKLSTGKVVEEQMKEVALSLENEHPSHSLILDISDSCWRDVFLPVKRDEIRGFRCTEMPALCDEMLHPKKNAFLSLLHFAYISQNGIEAEAYLKTLSGLDEKSYKEAFRLLRSDFLPLQNQTEGNIVKHVWSCIDTFYDFSSIKCVGGEKCSSASADAGNRGRSVSDAGRQYSGRKMDYLFTTQTTEYEVGCGECALIGGVKTTKELYDGSFKMPKVMKDMANSILSVRSGLSHGLCIVGYLIAENEIQLLVLDFPAGYVARVDGFRPVFFQVETEISTALPPVLKIIIAGRHIMEATKAKIEHYQGTIPIVRRGMISGLLLCQLSLK